MAMTRLGPTIPSHILVFALSLLLHAGIVGLGLIQWPFGKSVHIRLDQPVVYQVDLVTLAPPAPGRPIQARPAPAASAAPEAAKPLPAQVNPPAPPPPQPKAEVKIPEQPKKAPAPAKPVQEAKKPKPPPAPKTEAKKPLPKKSEPSRDQILAEALGAARQNVADRATDEREQALASLRREVASGDGGAGGAPGGVAAGGLVEVYAQLVEGRIKSHWRYPQVASQQDLSATLEIRLTMSGQVLETRIIRSSGRADFDASTERAVEEAGELPPPPRSDLRTLRITFNLQEL